MSKKELSLVCLALALGGLYLVYFTNTFSQPTIRVAAQVRIPRATRANTAAATLPVSFTLNGKYKLTSVQVVLASDYRINKKVKPLWHLISDTNSIPSNGFVYGMKIPGMKPSEPKAGPQPLRPKTPYLLLVEAGKLKGETTFETPAIAAPTPAP